MMPSVDSMLSRSGDHPEGGRPISKPPRGGNSEYKLDDCRRSGAIKQSLSGGECTERRPLPWE
eukprot:4231279-Karenia_brevis.AAC.1